MSKKVWWANGIQFECQGSGKCCVSRDGYGYVYVTLSDRKRFATFLKLTTRQFTQQYCEKTDGYYHLKNREGSETCQFLDGARCRAYEARPTQCRTWPFWPEVMSPKKWNSEVAKFCPGVGKGKRITVAEIELQLKQQIRSEEQL